MPAEAKGYGKQNWKPIMTRFNQEKSADNRKSEDAGYQHGNERSYKEIEHIGYMLVGPFSSMRMMKTAMTTG